MDSISDSFVDNSEEVSSAESADDSTIDNITFPFTCSCGAVLPNFEHLRRHVRGKVHQRFEQMGSITDDPSVEAAASTIANDVVLGRAVFRPYRVNDVARNVHQNDALGIQLCIRYHVNFTVGTGAGFLANPHSGAETLRWAIRTKEAILSVKELNRSDPFGAGLFVLFPSSGELSAFQNLVSGPSDINVWGYRRWLSADDVARGRERYSTSLFQARVMISNDGLYHFSPTDLVKTLLEEKNIYLEDPDSGGVCVYLCARHFSDDGDCLFLDRYRQEASPAVEFTTTSTERVPVLDAQGKPIFTKVTRGKGGKVVEVQKTKWQTVNKTCAVPACQAYDLIEGRGATIGGILTFYSSYEQDTGGDAVYVHRLKGQEFLECSVIGVTVGECHYSITIHVEWKAGTYLLTRCAIKRTLWPVDTVRTGRTTPSFIVNGKVPSVLADMRARAINVNPSDAGSLTSFFEWCDRLVTLRLGAKNYANLSTYHEMISRAAKRSAEFVLLDRPSWGTMPGAGSVKDMAAAHRAQAVEEKVLSDMSVPGAYVLLTEKGSRAEFWVNAFAVGISGLKWLWAQFVRFSEWVRSGLFKTAPVAGLSVVRALLRLIAYVSPRVRGAVKAATQTILQIGTVAQVVEKLQASSQRNPKVMLVIDEVSFAAECLIVASYEEVLKRATPVGVSTLFGALEAIIEGLPELIESDFSAQTWVRLGGLVVLRCAAHTLLRLVPLPASILIHALANWIVERPHRRHWGVLLDEWSLNIMEEELDTLQLSNPVLHENTGLYLKTPKGERIPLEASHLALSLQSRAETAPKHVILRGDVAKADILCVPSCTLLDAINMYVTRLNKPLPYEGKADAWDKMASEFLHIFGDARMDIAGGTFKPLSYDQLCAYISERPAYTEARKTMLIGWVRDYEQQVRQSKKVDVGCKPKEVLQNQPALADEGNLATKTRPICPITPHGVVAMAVAVPFKDFLSGHTFFVWDKGTFFHVPHPVAAHFNVCVCYEKSPVPAKLNALARLMRGYYSITLLGHGDDGYVQFVDQDLRAWASATDAVSCDLTCGELHQKHFAEFVDYCSGATASRILQEQKAALSGEQRLAIKGIKERVYFEKKRVSTNTGEALTSTKAFYPQGVAFFAIVRKCMVNGIFDSGKYKLALETTWRDLGLIPEWETHKDTPSQVWYATDEVSFVGGYFYETEQGPTWQSISILKKYIIGPDVKSIYGQRGEALGICVVRHMAVLLTDPDMAGNYVTEALRDWFRRCVSWHGISAGDIAQARQTFREYIRRTDSWKYEKYFGAPAEVDRIPDEIFTRTVARICARHGLDHADADILAFAAEVRDLSGSNWCPTIHASMLPLFTLRFGAAKNQSKIAGLNFLQIVLLSGKKIFQQYQMGGAKPSQSKQAKQAKEAKREKHGAAKPAVNVEVERAIAKALRAVAPVVKKPAAPQRPRDPPVHITPSHAGALACANGYANHLSTSEPSPDLLGVGVGTSDKRVFTCSNKSIVSANASGFAYWAAEATGWVPNPIAETAQPLSSYIGGLGMATGGGIRRGPMVHFSNASYAGVTLAFAPAASTALQVPVQGCILQTAAGANTAPAGIEWQTLPQNFISNQQAVDMSSVAGQGERQTYTLSHLSARIEPDGYDLGAAGAVNVVSGDIQAYSYTAGDNREFNPHSMEANAGTAGVDASTWLAGDIPKHAVMHDEVSVDEWTKGTSLHVFAVPNTSCALGAWPATILDMEGAGSSTLASNVESPQIGYIITGAQPGQKFTVHWRVNLTAFGTETYDESASATIKRKPVDPTMIQDTLVRTLPQQAMPKVIVDGKANPAGVAAFGAHLADTGTPSNSIMPMVKTAAKVAEAAGSSGIVDVIADIGLGLLAMF